MFEYLTYFIHYPFMLSSKMYSYGNPRWHTFKNIASSRLFFFLSRLTKQTPHITNKQLISIGFRKRWDSIKTLAVYWPTFYRSDTFSRILLVIVPRRFKASSTSDTTRFPDCTMIVEENVTFVNIPSNYIAFYTQRSLK